MRPQTKRPLVRPRQRRAVRGAIACGSTRSLDANGHSTGWASGDSSNTRTRIQWPQ